MPKRTDISWVFVLAGAACTVGCAPSTDTVDRYDTTYVADYSDGFDNRDAKAVLRDCGAPEGVLWVDDGGTVRFEPPLDMDYDASVCVIEEVKKSGTTKFGFVGNEKHVTPEETD